MAIVYNIAIIGACVMNGELRIRMSENGRVVIPAAIRKALGIKAGDELMLHLDEDGMKLTTTRLRVARAQRLVRKYVKPGVSLVDELIAERRAEARKELK
jgi:AbrB family looped-hinge helix DNA binding protein